MKKVFAIITAMLVISQIFFGGLSVLILEAHAQIVEESALAVNVTEDCNGLTEDQPAPDPGLSVFPGGFEIDFPSEWPALAPISSGIPTYPAGHIDWKVNSFSEFLNSMGFAGSSEAEVPDLQIKTGIYSTNEGDPIDLESQAVNFKSPLSKLQYAWWVVQKNGETETLVSLNGVVAGGSAFGQQDLPIADGTRCGRATRTTQTDSDNDGMDDQWELRYAPERNIGTFRPADDADDDGFTAQDYQENETGEVFRIVADSQSRNGRRFATGDDEFSNLEEYIWGTNPLDADTDDDGYPDEADVAGIGQSSLKYLPSKIAGQSETVQVDAIGETYLLGKDDNLVTQILGYRVNLPVLLQQNLGVSLIPSNLGPQLGQAFQVQAISSGTNTTPGNLEYDWEITNNNTVIPINLPGAPCKLLSFNNIVECTFPPASIGLGMRISFRVTAFDPKLGIKAEGTVTVPIGGSVVITSNPTLVPQYPIDQTGEFVAAPAGDIKTGERWVEVTATLAEGSPESYHFDWYVDEQKVEDTCSKTPLAFTGKAAPQGMRLCGVGTNIMYFHATQVNAHNYTINLKVFQKQNGDPLSDEEIVIYTDPSETPYPGQTLDAATGLLQVQNALVSPNEQIVVRAVSPETSERNLYQYVWSVDGQVVSSGNDQQIQLTAQPEKEKYDIQLQIVEKNGEVVLSQKTATTSVAVIQTSKFEIWRDSRTASVQTALYPFYHTMAGNTSLFLVIAGIVIIISIYATGKKEGGLV